MTGDCFYRNMSREGSQIAYYEKEARRLSVGGFAYGRFELDLFKPSSLSLDSWRLTTVFLLSRNGGSSSGHSPIACSSTTRKTVARNTLLDFTWRLHAGVSVEQMIPTLNPGKARLRLQPSYAALRRMLSSRLVSS